MIIERRDVGPGTDLPHTRQLPEQAASEKLRRDMMVHRSRYADYCTILTKLAQHYSEYFMGHASIELSTRMDAAATGSPCTPSLLAAFPTTPDVRAMIESAREACQLNNRKGCEEVILHQSATAK
ncbi:hypothetical protein [Caulobacter sp. S45]|uniref:hypothetical protein n=1 Tax=Caulobacter sp. S45 TaxID=1641861 RepID=UPI00157511D0|nr:hypothetical protein [Caulobacter sp. S45]